MRTKILAVMAKYPATGAVKTRLCPPLDLSTAAALYFAFLRDMVRMAADVDCDKRYLAVYPGELAVSLEAKLPSSMVYVPQVGKNLGERMLNLARQFLGDGCRVGGLDSVDTSSGRARRLAIVGSDSPTLPVRYIDMAFDMLEDSDVVIGPSVDGGYYLIGMSKSHSEIFEGIPWGGDRVLERTVEKAADAGLSVTLLPEWYDVDTKDDLRRLGEELSRKEHVAPHTRAFLGNRNI